MLQLEVCVVQEGKSMYRANEPMQFASINGGCGKDGKHHDEWLQQFRLIGCLRLVLVRRSKLRIENQKGLPV